MQRDRRRDAGVLVHLGGVGDLLVRITRHARLGEHLEPGPGVAEGPRRQLDLLLAEDALDTLTIHSAEPALSAIGSDGVIARDRVFYAKVRVMQRTRCGCWPLTCTDRSRRPQRPALATRFCITLSHLSPLRMRSAERRLRMPR